MCGTNRLFIATTKKSATSLSCSLQGLIKFADVFSLDDVVGFVPRVHECPFGELNRLRITVKYTFRSIAIRMAMPRTRGNALALIPVSLLPSLLGMSGKIYLFGALALGLWYLYSGVRVAFDRTILRARAVLLVSVLYLPLIYGLMLLDRPSL